MVCVRPGVPLHLARGAGDTPVRSGARGTARELSREDFPGRELERATVCVCLTRDKQAQDGRAQQEEGGGGGMKKLILAYVGATSECDLGERSGRELGGAAAHSQEEGAEGGDGGRHDARANRRHTVCAQNKSIQIRARILELLLLPSPHRPPPAAGRCLHIHS